MAQIQVEDFFSYNLAAAAGRLLETLEKGEERLIVFDTEVARTRLNDFKGLGAARPPEGVLEERVRGLLEALETKD